MIVAYREENRAVCLYAFAKSDRDNLGSDELVELRKLGLNWLNATPKTIFNAVEDGQIQEVDLGE
jgi:hypothetical protein